MSADQAPTRVRFYDGQFLQAEDLRDDQNYHTQMRRRHNLALHSWGIVSGLEPRVESPQSDRARLVVGRGMAIDGYGRELVVTATDPVALNDRSKDTTYDVWLYYRLTAVSGPSGAGGDGCGPSAEEDHLEERPEVVLRPTTSSRSPDPSKPDEVPLGDLDFRPEAPLPEGQDPEWPVFLGRLAYGAGGWAADGSLRRPAGLVAGQVVSPARLGPDDTGRTVIVNGREPGLNPYVFAVMTSGGPGPIDPSGNPPFLAVAADGAGPARLELTAGRVRVAADMAFKDGAALEFQPNLLGGDSHQGVNHELLPAGAEHWRIYHHFEPPPAPSKTGGPAAGGFSDELRVTMPAGPDGLNRVVFGSFSDKGKFTPVLAVLDNGTVEVYGTLTVEGVIHGRVAEVPAGSQGAAAGTSSPELLDQLVARLSAGPGRIEPTALIDRLADAGLWDKVAVAVSGSLRPDAVIAPVAAALWSTSVARPYLGTKASTSKDDFQSFLAGLPATAPAAALQVGFFADWVFADVPERRAVPLADNLPADPQNKNLKAFAAALVDGSHDDRLKALFQALAGADAGKTAAALAAADGGATLKKLLAGLAPTSAAPLIDALNGLSGTAEGTPRADALKALGKVFPKDDDDARNFSAGLTDGGRSRAVDVFEAILGTDAGRDAAIDTLKQKPPTLTAWPPSTPAEFPNDAPLKVLFKRAKDNGGTVTMTITGTTTTVTKPFTDVIKALSLIIDSL